MKLRNKKTGEIVESFEFGIQVELNNARKLACYSTLQELNEEWEDYKPTEPLIKDEKIRKAVRAWAETEGIEEVAVLCHTVWEGKMTEIAKPDDVRLEITLRRDLGIKMGKYSIAELCGEEE